MLFIYIYGYICMCSICLQSALFNFQSLLSVVLLLICTCAYIRAIAPKMLDKNKEGWVDYSYIHMIRNTVLCISDMMQTRYNGVPLYPTWWMRRQFGLQQVPTLKDVLPIVLSDENAPKTRIFCKIGTFHIYFCPLLKLFYTFLYPGYSPEK